MVSVYQSLVKTLPKFSMVSVICSGFVQAFFWGSDLLVQILLQWVNGFCFFFLVLDLSESGANLPTMNLCWVRCFSGFSQFLWFSGIHKIFNNCYKVKNVVHEISFESGNGVNFKILKSIITENLYFKVGIKSSLSWSRNAIFWLWYLIFSLKKIMYHIFESDGL